MDVTLIDNAPSSSDDSFQPFSAANADDTFIPPATTQQQYVCGILGVNHGRNVFQGFPNPTSKATGDGNCFFNAVSLCISQTRR